MKGVYDPGRQVLHRLPSSALDLQEALCPDQCVQGGRQSLSLTTQFFYGWTQKGGGFHPPLTTLQKQRSDWGDLEDRSKPENLEALHWEDLIFCRSFQTEGCDRLSREVR